jgi:MFS family permease
MFAFVRETKTPKKLGPRINLVSGFRTIDSRLKLYLLVVFVFTLGNSSNTFLLLRAQKSGFSPSSVILLYFVYNIVSSILSIPFGKLSDIFGRKKLLVAGYLIFSIVYGLFAFANTMPLIVGAFVLYGFFTALTAGVERAFIAEIAPSELKGTMLGLHSTIVGIALLPASVIAGILWTTINQAAPFAFGSALSLCAAVILIAFLGPGKKHST